MAETIAFVHAGTAAYVPYALLQARVHNPDAEIVLLGDRANAHLAALPGVRHENTENYNTMAGELKKVFRNFSSNPPLFERVCLERWMHLLEYMQAHHLDRLLYLDTDVLLYTPAHLGFAQLPPTGMTVAGISGHTNYIRGQGTLQAFCQYILTTYSTPAGLAFIEDEFTEFRKRHRLGGISDMSFFTWFRQLNPNLVQDIAPVQNHSAYDITLDYAQGFEEKNGIKKLTMGHGHPVAYQKKEGSPPTPVEMRTLHFQGQNKPLMGKWCQAPPYQKAAYTAYNQVFFQVQRLWRRLSGRRRQL